jgi:hypothetical protein
MEATKDLLERFEVIERLIQEGRQTTQNWGWVPLLWGIGQIVAIVWGLYASRTIVAWLVTMWSCALLSGVLSWLIRRRGVTTTTVGRALSAIWTSVIIAMFILGFVGGFTGALSYRAILAILLCLQGTGNFASGAILRWPIQIGVAVLWWIAAAFAMFVPWPWVIWDFIIVTALGDVLFGICLMVFNGKDRAIA